MTKKKILKKFKGKPAPSYRVKVGSASWTGIQGTAPIGDGTDAETDYDLINYRMTKRVHKKKIDGTTYTQTTKILYNTNGTVQSNLTPEYKPSQPSGWESGENISIEEEYETDYLLQAKIPTGILDLTTKIIESSAEYYHGNDSLFLGEDGAAPTPTETETITETETETITETETETITETETETITETETETITPSPTPTSTLTPTSTIPRPAGELQSFYITKVPSDFHDSNKFIGGPYVRINDTTFGWSGGDPLTYNHITYDGIKYVRRKPDSPYEFLGQGYYVPSSETQPAPWNSNIQIDVAQGDGYASSTTPNAVYGNRFRKVQQIWYLPVIEQTGYGNTLRNIHREDIDGPEVVETAGNPDFAFGTFVYSTPTSTPTE